MSIWRVCEPYVSFAVAVRATPKQRHDKKNRTPLATRIFERRIIGESAKEVMLSNGLARLSSGRVGLRLKFYFVDGKRDPDQTNVEKSVEDGMNGIVYTDDEMVKYSEVEILPCTHEDDERVEVEILWL